MYGYLLDRGILPSELANISRKEKLTILALIRLNEEEKESKLISIISRAMSIAYGGK